MNRRDILTFGILLVPFRGFAQQPARIPVIGYLQEFAPLPGTAEAARYEAFRQGLRQLGYVDGKNVRIEHRTAEGKRDRLPGLAAELVKLKVDVIVADGGTPPTLAAKNATRTIPIVFPTIGDPVAQGIVASLGRPGGNLTGLSLQAMDATGKRLEFALQIVPKAKRIALLTNPANPTFSKAMVREFVVEARKLDLFLHVAEMTTPAGIDVAMAEIGRMKIDAVLITSDGMLVAHSKQIAAQATKLRLPTIGENAALADNGGLATFGPDRLDMLRRAAGYVDRILKGAKPADMPIEQPLKWELVVNLNTARALGIRIPQIVLGRADRVIE